jgi:hypothetical protein
MESKDFQQLIDAIGGADASVHRVSIGESAFSSLTREQAEEIVARFGANTLITLPRRERDFFSWLRNADRPVWDDLWGDEQDIEQTYVVSIAFLPELLPRRRGFLICDLVNQQNYYFTEESITSEEGRVFLEAALDIVHANGRLTMEQALVVEAWRAPIDQWRFAYNYGLPLDEVRRVVQWLVAEGILLLPPREEADAAGESLASGDA